MIDKMEVCTKAHVVGFGNEWSIEITTPDFSGSVSGSGKAHLLAVLDVLREAVESGRCPQIATAVPKEDQ